MFPELKLEQISPAESTEILEAINVSPDVRKRTFHLSLF